jgi:glycosyltransferase involved in cell wall biosynthesis
MKISVVIPLYNKRISVLRALNSVLEQTIQPFEIIVVNDGSTDGSEQLVNELNHPLVKLFHLQNAGVSAARNRGIAEAICEWIAFLDADDEWKPEFLETIKFLSAVYPSCNVLATAYLLQDHQGNQKKIILNNIAFSEDHGTMANYFEIASSSHPPLWTSAVVVRKSSIEAIGGFPVGIKSGEDLLTWARLAVNNKIAYSIRPLSVFIQDAGHTYSERPTRVPQYPDIVGRELKVLAKQNKKIPGISNYVALWFKMRSSIYLRLGMKKHAFIEALKSLSFRPLNLRIYIYIVLLILPLSTLNNIFRRYSNS